MRLRVHVRHAVGWLLLPFGISLFVLIGIPALMTIGLAFVDYDTLSAPRWLGMDNFKTIITDPFFEIALRNSFHLVVSVVPLRVAGALGCAVLLQHRRRGTAFARSAVVLPTFLPDVAYALLGLWVFNPLFGPINMLLQAVGLPMPTWFVDATSSRIVIILMMLFQFGEGMVLLIAGLNTIPRAVHEAAVIDGATRWTHFRFITLPLVAPWLLILTARDCIMSLQGTFTPALLMTKGEPYYATLYLPLYIYQEAFDRFRFGTSSAMMVLMFAGLACLFGAVLVMIRRWRWFDA